MGLEVNIPEVQFGLVNYIYLFYGLISGQYP